MNIIDAVGKYKQAGREWYGRSVGNINKITVHHTASQYKGTNHEILTKLKNGHVNHGWVGLSYHFIILKNGNIYQINNLTDVTWHDTRNWDTLAVCLHGYYHWDNNKIDDNPTKEQLESLKWLLDELTQNHPEFPAGRQDVIGHREVNPTACPGDKLYPLVVKYRETGEIEHTLDVDKLSIKEKDWNELMEYLQLKADDGVQDAIDEIEKIVKVVRREYEGEIKTLKGQIEVCNTKRAELDTQIRELKTDIEKINKKDLVELRGIIKNKEQEAKELKDTIKSCNLDKKGLELKIETMKESSVDSMSVWEVLSLIGIKIKAVLKSEKIK